MVKNAPMAVHLPIPTPCGFFLLCEEADQTLSARWDDSADSPGGRVIDRCAARATGANQWLLDLRERLVQYFDGEAVSFADVPTPAGPRFFQRCWDACRTIPAGETRSYAELAVLAGATSASARAAGQAMRRNRLPVIVPCHRVIASTGLLHGYAGCTDNDAAPLHRKKTLLAIEGSCAPLRASARYDS